MTAMFPGSSRMANFREKKNSGHEENIGGTNRITKELLT